MSSSTLSSLKLKKSPKKVVRKTTPIRKEEKNVSSGNENQNLISTRRDFLLLSLSISLGLFIFVIVLYLSYKIYVLLFGGSDISSEEDLSFLDNLEEEEEKEEEEEEEVNPKIIDGEDMEEVV